jgi:hypothetical protein
VLRILASKSANPILRVNQSQRQDVGSSHTGVVVETVTNEDILYFSVLE